MVRHVGNGYGLSFVALATHLLNGYHIAKGYAMTFAKEIYLRKQVAEGLQAVLQSAVAGQRKNVVQLLVYCLGARGSCG